jgi:nifR3 family TIM-barrel protein
MNSFAPIPRAGAAQPEVNGRRDLFARARNPFWLAPMAGITDVVFRRLMDEMQAGVLVSELVSAKGLLFNSTKTRTMTEVHENPGAPVGVQLFGESAEDIITAACGLSREAVDFIDINLGCPVKKVVKKGSGAALMRDPAHLEKYLTRIRRSIDHPLTVKMRTGWSDDELTIHECVAAAESAGCEWVAIHGRTRAQGYEGRANWDLIADLARKAHIPIIGNGDIRSARQARDRLLESGVDAVMIGRAALRNPWLFRECLGQDTGHRSPFTLLSRYRELLADFYDARNTLLRVRKYATWLAFGYPGAAAFRRGMFECHTQAAVMDLAREFFRRAEQFPPPTFEDSEAFMMGGHG